MFTSIKFSKLILLTIMVLLGSSKVFSQKLISNNNDTLICFTSNECKSILKEFSRANYLDSLNRLQTSEISALNVTIQDLKKLAELKSSQLILSQKLLEINQVEIETLNSTIQQQKKTIKREKSHKIVALIGGFVSTGVVLYFYIKK